MNEQYYYGLALLYSYDPKFMDLERDPGHI